MKNKNVSLICALFSLLILSVSPTAFANNMTLTSVSLGAESGTSNKRSINFDISWENSWFIDGAPSAIANWDAAWVFAKYSVYSAGTWSEWKHCKLSPTTGDHTLPGGTPASPQLSVGATGSYGMGVFFYRGAAGTGTNNWTDAGILWDYGADSVADDAVVRVKLFATEMVYIPAGGFKAGDNATSTASLKQGSADTDPWDITSDDAIYVTAAASNGYYYVSNANSGEAATGSEFTIPTEFPAGYDAFYMMKYEITQQEYAEFLNTLTSTQQGNRADAALNFNAYRNFIKKTSASPAFFGVDADNDAGTTTAADKTKLNEATDGKWIACNYVSWMDQAAYGDWAGLRPFTELEFEKAARGPQVAVAGEYAWGDTTISAATGPDNSGLVNEKSTLATARAVYNGTIQGPIRGSGIAANSDGTRARSGAGYYGVRQLSGNLWERPVTVGNATGRLFTGTHGDGLLSAAGHATNSDWPGVSSGQVTGATGSGFRGGTWLHDSTYARVSDRYYASFDYSGRISYFGARLARTAP